MGRHRHTHCRRLHLQFTRSVRKRRKNIAAAPPDGRFQHSAHCVFRFFSIEFHVASAAAAATTDVDCDMGWERERAVGWKLGPICCRSRRDRNRNMWKTDADRESERKGEGRLSQPSCRYTLPPIPARPTECPTWGRSLVYIGFRYNIQKLRKRIYIHQI